jgi:hypothetical protein
VTKEQREESTETLMAARPGLGSLETWLGKLPEVYSDSKTSLRIRHDQ